jgi:hypothetical protein
MHQTTGMCSPVHSRALDAVAVPNKTSLVNQRDDDPGDSSHDDIAGEQRPRCKTAQLGFVVAIEAGHPPNGDWARVYPSAALMGGRGVAEGHHNLIKSKRGRPTATPAHAPRPPSASITIR